MSKLFMDRALVPPREVPRSTLATPTILMKTENGLNQW